MSSTAENRFVGSGVARAAAVLFGAVLVGLIANYAAMPPYRFYVALLAGILTWLSLVHSSRVLFRLWMRFAEGLQTVAVTALFSICYLVIVPLFRLVLWHRDPLRLRRGRNESSWVARTSPVDAASLERMG